MSNLADSGLAKLSLSFLGDQGEIAASVRILPVAVLKDILARIDAAAVG
jgi:hypothetical protein